GAICGARANARSAEHLSVRVTRAARSGVGSSTGAHPSERPLKVCYVGTWHRMAIPTTQLDTWSHQGAIATAQATHVSVRAALSHAQSLIRTHDYEVFLQGSYRNATNIYAESDVDIVVQLKETLTD